MVLCWWLTLYEVQHIQPTATSRHGIGILEAIYLVSYGTSLSMCMIDLSGSSQLVETKKEYRKRAALKCCAAQTEGWMTAISSGLIPRARYPGQSMQSTEERMDSLVQGGATQIITMTFSVTLISITHRSQRWPLQQIPLLDAYWSSPQRQRSTHIDSDTHHEKRSRCAGSLKQTWRIPMTTCWNGLDLLNGWVWIWWA